MACVKAGVCCRFAIKFEPGASHMRFLSVRKLALRSIGVVLLACAAAGHAQQIERGVAIVSEDIASRVDGFSYRPDSSSTLGFRGTALAPRADGTAKIHTTQDRTEIAGRFEHLPMPASFGPFAVYVLWVVTPEGRAINAGVLEQDGEKAKMNGTTPLSSFALIVTAEPHFAVSVPSKYIVLQNFSQDVQGSQLVITSLAARADYTALKAVSVDPKAHVPVDLIMAQYALSIADHADAGKLAPKAYDRARQALAGAESAEGSKTSSIRARVSEMAREAIQAAEDARAAAEFRRSAENLEGMRREIADRGAKLEETEILAAQARQAALAAQAQQHDSADHFAALQHQWITPEGRLQRANQLLSRWLVLDVGDNIISVHIDDAKFVKGRTDLTIDARERLDTAAGIVLGIGSLAVTVTPTLQTSEDVRKLGLSQQRARSVMEWLASLGVKAKDGVPVDTGGAVEKALGAGAGVDLLISYDGDQPAIAPAPK
jgi:outer membrane protein OmpA-like peptidoglycan-associated protein